MIVEIPAGNMDRQGENVEACVQRELAEEVGFQAGRLIRLFEGYLVPGYCNEYMHFSSPSISNRRRFRPTRTSTSGWSRPLSTTPGR